MLLEHDKRRRKEDDPAKVAATARAVGASHAAQEYGWVRRENLEADGAMVAQIYADALEYLGKPEDLEGIAKIEIGLKGFIKPPPKV